jgi:hypothetical protein
MGGEWSFQADSSDISSSNNVVTVTLPSSGVSGVWFQTAAGTPSASSFTAASLTDSSCSGTDDDVVASSNGVSVGTSVSFTISQLTSTECETVDVALGYSSGYTPGTIITKTLDLCTAETTASGTAVTPAAITTVSETTTTTTTTTTNSQLAGNSSDFTSYLFSPSDEYNAFWYVVGSRIKFFWDVQFDSIDNKWTGIGFGASDTGMGPGYFYVSNSNDLSVQSAYLDGSSGQPTIDTTDTTVIQSGCEAQENRLYCWVDREIDGTGVGDSADLNPDMSKDQYIKWAFGDLSSEGGFGEYHGGNAGQSDITNPIQTAVSLPSLELSGGTMVAQWVATPSGNLDVHTNLMNNDDDNVWAGVGFGLDDSSMGPGEFYTGQLDTIPNVKNRYLDGSVGMPSVKSISNVLASGCYSEETNMTCWFTRPLVADSSDAVDLSNNFAYLRVAHGSTAAGDISVHGYTSDDIALSAESVDFTAAPEGGSLGSGESSSVLYKLHGCLMIITWLFFLPYGIYVARFRDGVSMGNADKPKDAPPTWFVIHQPFQYIGVILMIISIIVIFVQAGPMTSSFLSGTFSQGAHEIVGIVSFALTLCQPIFAFFRNKCHDAWHIIHAICGYTALVLALAAVGLGIAEYRLAADWPILWTIGYILAVGGLFIFILVGIGLTLRFVTLKSKKVGGNLDAEAGVAEVKQKLTNYSFVAWLLMAILLIGAILCIAAVAMDDSRG